MHIFFIIGGTVLIAVTLFDAFVTIILPRTVTSFRPSVYFFRLAWKWWGSIGHAIRDPYRRQTFYSVFGPLSVPSLLFFWGISLIFGFAMLHWGTHSQISSLHPGRWAFGTMLYFSGTTFFTLGLGDITALNPLGRFLIVLEAAIGFISLAIIVGYLPLLDQAFSQRETRLTLFGLRSGSPQCAARLLAHYGKPNELDKLAKILNEGEEWIAELLQSQLSHPVLAYYRSQHLGQSWLASLVTYLDFTSLLQAANGHSLSLQVKTSFRMALYALVEMVRVMKVEMAAGADRLQDSDFERLRVYLEKVEISFPEGGAGAQALRDLRRLYEPYAVSLSKDLRLRLPIWVPPEDEEF